MATRRQVPAFRMTESICRTSALLGITPLLPVILVGLYEIDLNSPEPEPKTYGPYPVNRAVVGREGNAGFLVPAVRSGILIHTVS